MKTVIISDTHLGNGQGYDIFAGETALPAFLCQLAAGPPSRVVLNGDAVDFLMNEDPLILDVARAVRQARDIVGAPASAAVLEALGLVLAAGGEVVVRLGNHDIELALPEVQTVFRSALGQPAEIAARLQFVMGDAPTILEVGGARILLGHGEQNDPWNQVDYPALHAEPVGGGLPDYRYAPGSRLVKTLLNPLKRTYGMRFADLLKPDFQGGALTALAVDPAAVKVVFQGSTLTLTWQILGRQAAGEGGFTFDDSVAVSIEPDLGLFDRFADAGLDDEEREAIEALLDDDGPMAFGGEDSEVVSRASAKLLRAGLREYAKLQRRAAGDESERYFEIEPLEAELTEAHRLAEKYSVDAVVLGHTHSARFKRDAGLCFVNTGTWIWLMGLPPADAPLDAWTDFLVQLRANPGMDPALGPCPSLVTRFTAAFLDEHPDGGARLSLVEWLPDRGEVTTIAQERILGAVAPQ